MGRDEYEGRDFGPLGFDESGDFIYVYARNAAGRLAVYKVSADERRQRELVHEDPRVDVDGLETLGPQNRMVGVSWTDDVSRTRYLDPELAKLDKQVGRAIKGRAIIAFTGVSSDGNKLLVYAGSDRDPGRYYLLDKAARQLRELVAVRAGLADVPLGEMREITYPARDGTPIPAYLTLPPGKPEKGLPLIVMPHGGPSARDSWGFDFLVQYYAAQGYAVVQPNYRGSTGFGKSWNAKTAVENWRTAISDINDAPRALARQGLADPQRTAIVGWSYGGYAALMGGALEPDLYKAVVAIAPVTDWLKVKRALLNGESTAARLLAPEMGSSDSNLAEGSPVRHAARIAAPVLMFHGDRDANVLVGQSRDMDAALKAAGKRSELVVYPGLENSLVDGVARTDMLRRSGAFVAAALGGEGGTAAAGR